ncbi:MAG TPA: APC family permease, partial [Acidobacteriota bacterium]|nr:APC family permease [Acidobacteriota bacterium]
MEIKPRLGFFDLTMIVISLVIGIGIFRTPQIVASKAGEPFIFFLAWVVGGVVSLCGALTFAEIGSRYPVAGGFYRTFSYCYHPAYAFMLNWVLVATNAASNAGVAMIGAEYIQPLLPPALQGARALAVAMVAVLFVLNYLGIRMGARTQNVLSGAKVVMIFLLCAAGWFAPPAPAAAAAVAPIPSHWIAFGVAMISVFFTYGGYQQTINFGADIQEPQRNVPRGIFAAIAVILFLYLSINYAYVRALGFETVRQSPLLAADLARVFFGPAGAAFTSVAIFTSVLGFVNVSMMSNPRVYYAMAEDRTLPPVFENVNERTQVQEFALTFFAGLVILMLFMLGTFERIVNYVMFIDTISLASAAACIFILRRRQKGRPYAGYSVRPFPVAPLIFIVTIAVITLNVLYSD